MDDLTLVCWSEQPPALLTVPPLLTTPVSCLPRRLRPVEDGREEAVQQGHCHLQEGFLPGAEAGELGLHQGEVRAGAAWRIWGSLCQRGAAVAYQVLFRTIEFSTLSRLRDIFLNKTRRGKDQDLILSPLPSPQDSVATPWGLIQREAEWAADIRQQTQRH